MWRIFSRKDSDEISLHDSDTCFFPCSIEWSFIISYKSDIKEKYTMLSIQNIVRVINLGTILNMNFL